MIPLTNTVGLAMWINPDHVVFMVPHHAGGTIIMFAHGVGVERVKENCDEIRKLIRNRA